MTETITVGQKITKFLESQNLFMNFGYTQNQAALEDLKQISHVETSIYQ